MTRVFASILATLALLGASWLAGVAREAAEEMRPVSAVTATADTYNGGK